MLLLYTFHIYGAGIEVKELLFHFRKLGMERMNMNFIALEERANYIK